MLPHDTTNHELNTNTEQHQHTQHHINTDTRIPRIRALSDSSIEHYWFTTLIPCPFPVPWPVKPYPDEEGGWVAKEDCRVGLGQYRVLAVLSHVGESR